MKTSSLPALSLIGVVCATAVLSATGGAVAGSLLTGADIRDESLTSRDIRNRSIQPIDVSMHVEKTLQRIGGYRVVNNELEVPAGSPETLSASCPKGTRVLGVSGYWRDSNAAVQAVIAPDGTFGSVYTQGIPAADVLRINVTCGRVA